MSIGMRALRSAGAATIALATACTLTLATAGSASADTGPTANAAADLPLPPGATSSYPAAINDNGVIVGYTNGPNNQMSPVRWNPDLSPTTLPLLPGDPMGYVEAVSDDGTAAGWSGSHTVRWAPDGTVTQLQPLPGDTSADFRAMSRTGIAVGESALGGTHHAVKWRPDGQAVQLAPLKGDTLTFALSVNSSGTVAGVSFSDYNAYHPVKWNPDGTPVPLDPTSAYSTAWVVQINDAGTVLARGAVPTGGTIDQSRSVTWGANGTVTDLGPHSSANAINASGTVVGRQLGADNTDYTATSWSPDGTATAIGSAYEYTTAVAVNDAGVSVGYTGVKVPSDQHRFALLFEADGSLTELNVTPDGSNSYATSINNAGVAVGVRITFPTPGSSTRTAVIWRP
ncbi:hypothetical protein [Streptomyces sp. A1-5]|uniref:hypothetical protein n=1 Tax=Streptomyces sp. A1-5 TaxID=2738410 RepID=UPI001F4681E4|nr:hypothetical protein [Streptomyces sp. A1-5]UJB44836.1 hypothetical protein HRD51_32210 [Streptomyces sp. A1-5]